MIRNTEECENVEKNVMTPIFLSPRDRKIVIFGGGKVALRKCMHFYGFRMIVVADEVLPEIEGMASEVVKRHIDPGSVEEMIVGSDIVIAATNDKKLNDSIRDIAFRAGIAVNSAHGGGDVLIPSVLRKDKYTVAVSTEGKVPAFPPYIINILDDFLDESYDLMMDLLIYLRALIKVQIPTQTERAKYLEIVLNDHNIWRDLRDGNLESAKKYALKIGGLKA